jgi:hypothetical protein
MRQLQCHTQMHRPYPYTSWFSVFSRKHCLFTCLYPCQLRVPCPSLAATSVARVVLRSVHNVQFMCPCLPTTPAIGYALVIYSARRHLLSSPRLALLLWMRSPAADTQLPAAAVAAGPDIAASAASSRPFPIHAVWAAVRGVPTEGRAAARLHARAVQRPPGTAGHYQMIAFRQQSTNAMVQGSGSGIRTRASPSSVASCTSECERLVTPHLMRRPSQSSGPSSRDLRSAVLPAPSCKPSLT